jgi:hypothetical protein
MVSFTAIKPEEFKIAFYYSLYQGRANQEVYTQCLISYQNQSYIQQPKINQKQACDLKNKIHDAHISKVQCFLHISDSFHREFYRTKLVFSSS